MAKLLQTALYTIRDQIRYKSFFILLIIAALFVFLVRGCYDADFIVNEQKLDNVNLAWHVSTIVFQVICYGMFLMASLIAMKLFSRDQSDGATVMFLSRPLKRWQYVLGRVIGTWLLCLFFMLILHLIIFGITWSKTGNVVYGFMTASLIVSINLLFIIVLVSLFSLFMPDFIAAFTCLCLVGVGFFSETGFWFLQSKVVQSMSSGDIPTDAALWRVVYPKISMLQYYAGTVIKESDFKGMGPVHPVINVLIYLLLAGILLVMVFNRKEIG